MRTADTVLKLRRVCRVPKRILKSIKDSSTDWYKTLVYVGALSPFRSWVLSIHSDHSPSVPLYDNSLNLPKFEKLDGEPCSGWTSSSFRQGGLWKTAQNELPHIVLVTVSQNDDRVLDGCINSVLSQNYPNLVYFLADIGSSDRSRAIIQAYRDHASVRILEGCHDRATGISKALEHPHGKIVNWLNPGDRLAPDALFKCARAFEEDPSAAGWVGGAHFLDRDGFAIKTIYPYGLDGTHIAKNWNGGQFYQPSCFLSKEIVKNSGIIDHKLGQAFETDLWLKVLENGHFRSRSEIWSLAAIHGRDAQSFIENYFLRQRETLKVLHKYRSNTLNNFLGKNEENTEKKNEFGKIVNNAIEYSNPIKKIGCSNSSRDHIAVLSYSLPQQDQNSADYRLHKIIKILLKNKCRIDFFYSEKYKNDDIYINEYKGDINFIYTDLDQKKYIERLVKENYKKIFITQLWRPSYFNFMTELCCSLKKNHLKSYIVVDTVDFHYKEFCRKYELSQDPSDLSFANAFFENEQILYSTGDAITVVSHDELNSILSSFPSLDSNKFIIIPNIHETDEKIRPFHKRKHMCFVGNFGTKHNVDAAMHFIEEILPIILNHDPKVEFHVIGNLSKSYSEQFKSTNVSVIGRVKNLRKYLSYYKLFVCPMTYGAGLKGKVGGAMEVGLPVVTTSIGAEGFPVTDGRECFIADSPVQFAEKSIQCLSDPHLWDYFSSNSRKMVNKNFSPDTIKIKLKKLLNK